MADFAQTIDSVVAAVLALGIVEFLLIVVVAILAVVLFFVGKYVLKEIKILKKDVNACHEEKRNLQERCDRYELSAKESAKRENLLSALVSEMRELIVNIKINKSDGET